MASTDPRLIQAVQELDSGTRALLDLSLRRAISDEKVAGALGVEIAEIPRRRARGIAELADKLAVPGPAELALLLVALPDLPEEAWGVPNPSLPKPAKVSKARRVRALRRVAVAASPLVAAAAVMAALIVSGGGDKHVQISATSALGGKQHKPAAAAKAPAKPQSPQSKLGMPAAPDIIASAQGPTPADLPSASASAARNSASALATVSAPATTPSTTRPRRRRDRRPPTASPPRCRVPTPSSAAAAGQAQAPPASSPQGHHAHPRAHSSARAHRPDHEQPDHHHAAHPAADHHSAPPDQETVASRPARGRRPEQQEARRERERLRLRRIGPRRHQRLAVRRFAVG